MAKAKSPEAAEQPAQDAGAPGLSTHNLVVCQTAAEGWSLHRPGATDDEIASGSAAPIRTGAGTPTQQDYDEAAAELARETA